MTADPLEEVLAAGAPHPLDADIPDALRGWLLEVAWDNKRLWALRLPTASLPLAELRWHYDLPWWRDEGRWFQVTPRQVLDAPAAYPEHRRRIRDADLSFPLHVVRRRRRWLVMDGIHRLARADLDGASTVAVHIVTPAVLLEVLV